VVGKYGDCNNSSKWEIERIQVNGKLKEQVNGRLRKFN
jgi:hypothetical protein